MNKLAEDVKFKSGLLIVLIVYLKDMLFALVNISMMFDESFEASLVLKLFILLAAEGEFRRMHSQHLAPI
jgi:hypothetical protein